MATALDIEQFEMLLGDPRLESSDPSVMEDLKGFIDATKRHGGLLAAKQVAAIANVSHSTVSRHIKAGRFTTYDFVDMTLLPLDEVMAYVKARNEELLAKGGHGLKSPKFKDLLKV